MTSSPNTSTKTYKIRSSEIPISGPSSSPLEANPPLQAHATATTAGLNDTIRDI